MPGSRQFGDVASAFKQISGLVSHRDRSGARDRAVHQAAVDRGRAGQCRDRQRHPGVDGNRDQRRPDAADRVANGHAVEGPAADHSAPYGGVGHGAGPVQILPARGARSARSVRQGHPRPREERERAQPRSSGCSASPTRSRAPPASSSNRRSPIGRTPSRMRCRHSAIQHRRHRARADRRDSGASRRDQQPDRHAGAGRRAAQIACRHQIRPDESPRTIRTDIAETDAVLDGVAETHALLNGLRGAAQGVEQARHLADLLLAQLAPLRTADQRPAIRPQPESAVRDRRRAAPQVWRRRAQSRLDRRSDGS